MTRSILAGVFVAAAAVLGLAPQANAQQHPCMADAARLCAGIEPGGGAQIECLKAHKDEVSPACKKKVLQMKIEKMEQQQLQEQEQGVPPPRQ
jgi:hypothetical protein